MKFKHMMLSAIACTSLAHADTTLTYNDADGQENSTMYLSDTMAKISSVAEVDTALVFNAKKNSFIVINHQEKNYMVFGEKEIAALGDVSAMVDRMLEEQLADMPAAQRDQMRGMMESMIKKQMPKQAAPPEYVKTGKNAVYNGFNCQVVVKTVEGKKDGEFCVADIDDLGISVAEYDSISQFMKTIEKLASQFGQDQSMNFASIGTVLPVHYDMGTQKAYLVDVSHESLSAQVFQVPEGYQKASLPAEMFK